MAWGLWLGCACGTAHEWVDVWASWMLAGLGLVVLLIASLAAIVLRHDIVDTEAVASARRALQVSIMLASLGIGVEVAQCECDHWRQSIGRLPPDGILTRATVAIGEPRPNTSRWKQGEPMHVGEVLSVAGHTVRRRVDLEFELAAPVDDRAAWHAAVATMPRPGDVIDTLAWWKPPRAFDGSAATARSVRGSAGTMVLPATGWRLASLSGPSEALAAARCRARAATGSALRAASALWPDRESRSVLACMVIGTEREGAAPALVDFATTGLTHLIAISGFNVAILAGGLLWVGRWFRLRRRGRSVLLLSGAVVFALAVQPDISATRAAMMGIVAGLAALAGLRFTPRALLAWVAILLLVDDPHASLRPGFQLSFVAVLALLSAQCVDDDLFDDRWRTQSLAHGLLAGTTLALALSLRVWLATIAIVWCHFEVVAFWGPLLTVVASPAAAVGIVLGSIAVAAGICSPALGACFALPAAACAWALTWVAHAGAAIPAAAVVLAVPDSLEWIAPPITLAATMTFLWVARQPVGLAVRRPVKRGWALCASLGSTGVASITRPSRNTTRSPIGPSSSSRNSIANAPRANRTSSVMPRRGSRHGEAAGLTAVDEACDAPTTDTSVTT